MGDYKLVPEELLKGWHERINTIAAETAFNVADEMESMLYTSPAVQGESVALPPFATKIIEKLRRFDVCVEDGQDVDIGRHWLDMLVQLGLLNRVQRSPALWKMAQQGEDVLEGYAAPQPAEEIGEVVVTKDKMGNIVSVTRQDAEGRVLSIIAESDRCDDDCDAAMVGDNK